MYASKHANLNLYYTYLKDDLQQINLSDLYVNMIICLENASAIRKMEASQNLHF